MDIFIKNKEYEGLGVLVLPKKDLYTIEFETDAKISMISFRSCSRTVMANDPRVGLNRKKYSINYRPNEVESEGACSVTITSLNKDNSFNVGFIDFEDPKTVLAATNVCGGSSEKTNGVSICQEKVSSMERIKFEDEVMTSPDFGCDIDKTEGYEFNYKVSNGICIYVFVSKKDPTKVHRHTVIGYQEAMRY